MSTLAAEATTEQLLERTKRRKARKRTDRIVITLLLLGAFLVAIYPVVATYNNNYKAYEFAQSQKHEVEHIPDTSRSEELAAAHAYNFALQEVRAKDPIGDNTNRADSAAYQAYLRELDLTDSMVTLRIPKIKLQLPIFHGTSDAVLAKGGGHMYGTSLPVGGPGTHAGLSAHRGLPQMTAFDRLPDLKMGDKFYIDVLGHTIAYQVNQIETVLPDAVDKVQLEPGRDLVTLVTCTPYGVNSHRLLVTGERVPWDEETSAPKQANLSTGFDWTIQSWMWMRFIIAGAALVAILGLAIWWLLKDRRDRRTLREKLAAAAQREAAAAQTVDAVPDAPVDAGDPSGPGDVPNDGPVTS